MEIPEKCKGCEYEEDFYAKCCQFTRRGTREDTYRIDCIKEEQEEE